MPTKKTPAPETPTPAKTGKSGKLESLGGQLEGLAIDPETGITVRVDASGR